MQNLFINSIATPMILRQLSAERDKPALILRTVTTAIAVCSGHGHTLNRRTFNGAIAAKNAAVTWKRPHHVLYESHPQKNRHESVGIHGFTKFTVQVFV